MNNRSLYFGLSFAAMMSIMAPLLAAQESNSTSSASEQRAMTVLKNMSEYLAQVDRFSVTIRDGYDAVQQSGQKIEYGEVRKVTVSRPNRLRFEVERSDGQKGLVIFNGQDLTVYTAKNNFYATVSKPGTLDEVIKYAMDDLKIRVPLGVLLLSALPSQLDNLIVSADYVETTTIMDVPCDHVAAQTSRGVDFQAWIAQGSEPLPRRIVITYKEETGEPQFWADLSNWNLAPEVSDAVFTFTPPEGAERIQFLAAVSNAAPMASPKKGGEK
jgi:hypothetical protein